MGDVRDYANHVSGQISALVEFGNAVDNFRKIKQINSQLEKITNEEQRRNLQIEKNEYYKQAGMSILLGTCNLVGNVVGGLKESSDTLNPYSRTINGVNGLTIAVRLRGNLEKAIEEHKQGYVNINRFQNILADIYSLGGLAGSLGQKDGSMRGWSIPLSFAGDAIGAYAIKTGDTGLVRVEDFYNMNNFTGFTYEKFEDFSRNLYKFLENFGIKNRWKSENLTDPLNQNIPQFAQMDIQSQNQDFISQGFAALLSDNPQQGMNQILNSDYAKTFDTQARQVLAQDDAQKQQELAQTQELNTPKMVRS